MTTDTRTPIVDALREVIEDAWDRAAQTAKGRGARAKRISERFYRVPGTESDYSVEITDYNKVVGCRKIVDGHMCRGWEIYISSLQDGVVRAPCYHAAAALSVRKEEDAHVA